MLDRTQALIQVPWAHLFSSSHVPILVVLGGAGLLCLNLLTLALFKIFVPERSAGIKSLFLF